LEVDGAAWFDGTLYAGAINSAGGVTILNNTILAYGSEQMGTIHGDQTRDQFVFATGAGLGRHVVFCDMAYYAKDYDHPEQTDPTFFRHSRTDPDTNNTQYAYQRHNMVDEEYGTGLGGIILAPQSGSLWKANQSYPTTKNYAEKMIHQLLTLATDSAETAVGVTPNGPLFGWGLRVSQEVAGLDSADHSISLGTVAEPTKYGTVSQGGAATTISVNKKFHGSGLAAGIVPEPAALVVTIAGGGDNIPTAGQIEIEIHFTEMSALADA
jgi:hypothetical protein